MGITEDSNNCPRIWVIRRIDGHVDPLLMTLHIGYGMHMACFKGLRVIFLIVFTTPSTLLTLNLFGFISVQVILNLSMVTIHPPCQDEDNQFISSSVASSRALLICMVNNWIGIQCLDRLSSIMRNSASSLNALIPGICNSNSV